MFATFTPADDHPDFIALSALVYFGTRQYAPDPRPSFSPFWHFERGGCNDQGLSLSISTAEESGLPTPWRPQYQLFDMEASYCPEYGLPGYGLLDIIIYRRAPIPLTAGTRYYAFSIDLQTCRADVCSGCEDMVWVDFKQAGLICTSGVVEALIPDAEMGFVDINGRPPAAPVLGGPMGIPTAVNLASEYCDLPVNLPSETCDFTPIRRSTWGELKVIYR